MSKNKADKIDEKFDAAETVVKRSGKLVLLVIATIAGIVAAGFGVYTQFFAEDEHDHKYPETIEEYTDEYPTEGLDYELQDSGDTLWYDDVMMERLDAEDKPEDEPAQVQQEQAQIVKEDKEDEKKEEEPTIGEQLKKELPGILKGLSKK